MRISSRVLAVAALTATVAVAVGQTPAPAILPPSIPVAVPTPMAVPKSQATEGPKMAPMKMAAPMLPAEPTGPMLAIPMTPPTAPPMPCTDCGTPAASMGTPKGPRIAPHNGPPESFWFSSGTSINWLKSHPLPFPIAIGSANGPPRTLLGETTRDVGSVYGFKLDAGYWANEEHTFGFGLGGFMMEQASAFDRAGGGANNLTIVRPFTDAVTQAQNSILVANPALGTTGSIALGVGSRFSGFDATMRRNVTNCDGWTFDLTFGFRYLDLDESLAVYQRTTFPNGGTNGRTPGALGTPIAFPAGSTVLVTDRFRTRNQFYGADLGSLIELRQGIVFLDLTPRVAFGPTHQITEIDGRTTVAGGNTVRGGLLATGGPGSTDSFPDGNIGRFTTSRFTLVTELGAQLGVQLTKSARVAVGYNFLYLNNVARPASQYSGAVNPRTIPLSQSFGTLSGSRAPQLTLDREDFYSHGVSATFQLMY